MASLILIACLTVGFFAYYFGSSSAYQSGLSEGFNNGYADGILDSVGSGYNIRDPTYAEALSFIASDDTETGQYVSKHVMSWDGTSSHEYTCFDYCNDFLMNAFNQGLKAGFVYIEFEDASHGIVCFDTVDRGLIFVEPQTDDVVSLKAGGAYELVEAPNIVESFTVIW